MKRICGGAKLIPANLHVDTKRSLNLFIHILLLVIISSCANLPAVKQKDTYPEKSGIPEGSGETAFYPAPEPEPSSDILTIVAAGDNLYHHVMIPDGEDGDYTTAYSEIKALIQKADIAFINQETLLAGKDYEFSGYPLFNTPQEVGRAVAASGFNVVNHATNHIMDKGEKAITATMDFWDTEPQVQILGISRSEEAKSKPVIIEKNNIKTGFLSYTYGTNNIPVPKDKSYMVSLINREKMAREINLLRPLCDFLVVSMHWGEEYSTEKTKEQEDLAVFLAEHKVDLVIGHHPHVLEPVEYILRPDGRFMLCYYSLGNFISAQTQIPALLGALAYIRIEKTPAGSASENFIFVDAGAIPLVTHYEKNFKGFKVYPLYDYTEEIAAKHRKNQEKKELTPELLTAMSEKILGDKEIRHNPFLRE